jgi:hypothetical protein
MPELTEIHGGNLDPAQALALALLVELEARWENLRKPPSRTQEVVSSTQALQSIQKHYEAFRARLAAYNKRYCPAHVPELLLNTPARLGLWCRAMRDLYLRVEDDPGVGRPVHLLEKAYRRADRVAGNLGKGGITRPGPPGSIRDAVQALDALGRWCDDLSKAG